MSRAFISLAVAAAICLGVAIISPALAAPEPPSGAAPGDAVAGRKQFGQCAVCHDAQANGPDKVGPNLFRVYGSKAATRRVKFAYSPALKASKLVWNDATLDRWLTDPAAAVPGTKMEFVGMPRKAVRANIIAYLKTLK